MHQNHLILDSIRHQDKRYEKNNEFLFYYIVDGKLIKFCIDYEFLKKEIKYILKILSYLI